MAPSLVYGLCSMLWSMVLRLETIQQWCLLYSPVTSLSRSSNSMLHIKSNDLFLSCLLMNSVWGLVFGFFSDLEKAFLPAILLLFDDFRRRSESQKKGEKREVRSHSSEKKTRGEIFEIYEDLSLRNHSFVEVLKTDYPQPFLPCPRMDK